MTGPSQSTKGVRWLPVVVVLLVLSLPLSLLRTDYHAKEAVVVEASNNTIGNDEKKQTFRIDYDGHTFLLNDQPFRYISGSVHYFRIPSELWKDRLDKIRAGGYNTIQFVVEWSSHTPNSPGVYDFEDRFNLVRFIQTAQEVGLYILLRVGPYVCAERSGGGLPYWLYARHPDIQLRTHDRQYLQYVDEWFDYLLPKLQPYLIQQGGPILMTQLENEYGSFGLQTGHCDTQYMLHLRDKVRQHFGEDHVLYTTDGASQGLVSCGSNISGVYPTIDFGPGSNVTEAFSVQRRFAPLGPLVNSEYYSGWLDYWGKPHSKVSVKEAVGTLREILDMGANVNIYMAHGGTSFGFEAGANIDSTFLPEPTSYDYDSPISEAGDLTPKYHAFRALFSKYELTYYQKSDRVQVTPLSQITVPSKANYGSVSMRFLASINQLKGGELLPLWGSAASPKNFEALGQNSGFILYETVVAERMPDPAILTLYQLRDRAYVFINEKFRGTLSRYNELPGDASVSMPLSNVKTNDSLGILVENQGRIGFGKFIKEFKGLAGGNVTLGNHQLYAWKMYNMPLNRSTDLFCLHDTATEDTDKTHRSPFANAGSFWGGKLVVSNCTSQTKLQDTFLKLDTGWGKGVAWINKVNVGRYWPMEGPQETLYIPGPYLFCGENRITLLELENVPRIKTVDFIDTPTLDGPTPTTVASDA